MTDLAPPLTGGYPVVALVTHAGEHETCGYVILSSDDAGTETITTGVGTMSKAFNLHLAEMTLVHAEQRQSLVRTWRSQLNSAIIEAGGEDYLDIPANIRSDDEAYISALELAADLAGERAMKRAAAGHAKTADSGPLTIAVDGSRSRRGRGAWAWISESGRWSAGDGEFTSPLHAEVTAISAALHSNVTDDPVLILCDSRDAIAQAENALAGGRPSDTVTNSVARVLGIIARNHTGRPITLEWVKGHTGKTDHASDLNDRADRLAVLTRRSGGLSNPDAFQLAESIADLTPMAA